MDVSRVKTLLFALYFCFFLLIGRFFYWQIVKGPSLREKALLQTYKLERVPPKRGAIFTRDSYPIVTNQTMYKLSFYKPDLKTNLDTLKINIEKIKAGFLLENQGALDKFFASDTQKWLTLPTLFTKEEVDLLKSPGLVFQSIPMRFYPENNLAKNILGFTTRNEYDTTTGLTGLEYYYNKQLQGKSGFNWQAQDALGQTILSKKGWQLDPVEGRDLYLNLQRNIQYQLEKELLEGISQYSADSASAIVMEPQTGEILAMASFESTKSSTPNSTLISNVTNLFEPGSIFKPLVMSMALDNKSISPDYICTSCDRPLTIGEYTINNWDNALHPNSTLKDIITNSDNIGMSSIIKRLGLKNFLNYSQKLGLFQKTGIDLPGEARPIPKTYWPEIDLATASFGQGLAVTQIQMIQAFNAIANDGILVHPKILNHFLDNTTIVPVKTIPSTRVYAQTTTDTMKDILKYAVENGMVSKFKPKSMEVCAKSGTAQVAVKGSYTDSSTIGSYIGFSPCHQPKFTMIVTINNPRTSPWGSSTAAPIWFKLAAQFNSLL